MIVKPLKPKKCKVCRCTFPPFRPLQVCCTTGCAIQYATKQREKAETSKAKIDRKELRVAKEKARPLSWYIKRTQAAVNKWVVHVRDKDEGCISCGTKSAGVYHAGHFIPTTRAIHRFNPANIRKQCAQCNLFKSGNIALYRAALIIKIGLTKVEELEGTQHELKRYTVEELDEIMDNCKQHLKGFSINKQPD